MIGESREPSFAVHQWSNEDNTNKRIQYLVQHWATEHPLRCFDHHHAWTQRERWTSFKQRAHSDRRMKIPQSYRKHIPQKPTAQSRCCAFHYKLYERLILMRISPLSTRSWQNNKQASYLVVHVEASSSTRLSTSKSATKEICWQMQLCRPVNCIRHGSTPTNDKKADGHDWLHRSMPGDSRPRQQSPLLCAAKWQEEPMDEPEEQIAVRKWLSPVTVQHLY